MVEGTPMAGGSETLMVEKRVPLVKQEPLDVKPKLATHTKSTKYLKRMLGGDPDCIVARIKRGNGPYGGNFVADDPVNQIKVELSEDDCEKVYDLSVTSMESTPVSKSEVMGLLKKLVKSHQEMGKLLDSCLFVSGHDTGADGGHSSAGHL